MVNSQASPDLRAEFMSRCRGSEPAEGVTGLNVWLQNKAATEKKNQSSFAPSTRKKAYEAYLRMPFSGHLKPEIKEMICLVCFRQLHLPRAAWPEGFQLFDAPLNKAIAFLTKSPSG